MVDTRIASRRNTQPGSVLMSSKAPDQSAATAPSIGANAAPR